MQGLSAHRKSFSSLHGTCLMTIMKRICNVHRLLASRVCYQSTRAEARHVCFSCLSDRSIYGLPSDDSTAFCVPFPLKVTTLNETLFSTTWHFLRFVMEVTASSLSVEFGCEWILSLKAVADNWKNNSSEWEVEVTNKPHFNNGPWEMLRSHSDLSGLLWTWQWNLGFHKGSYLTAFQEGLCSEAYGIASQPAPEDILNSERLHIIH